MLRSVVAQDAIEVLRLEATSLADSQPDHAHGIRGLLRSSDVITHWAHSEAVLKLLPENLRPVRGILFDKVPGANWKVAWHQDMTITVVARHDVAGYGPWSLKEDAWHVQPPMEVMEAMTTLRLHLDDTPAENGALRVIPASHLVGRLSAKDIARCREAVSEHVCEARAGDILLMKPLLLHASAPSTRPGHRRVVHIEYARTSLLHSALSWLCV